MSITVKEELATIKAQLKAIDERQERWFNLLQERIPKWDESATHANFLMSAYKMLLGGVISVIGGIILLAVKVFGK